MKMQTLSRIALALSLCYGTAAFADTMSKAEYHDAKDRIETEYKTALKPCDSLAGNTKKICTVEAKGSRDTALANLDARNDPSPKMQEKASDARAEAAYDRAYQKCQDKAGNDKDVCIKEAKAAEVGAKADAKAAMKTSVANADVYKTSTHAAEKASEKSLAARSDAAADKNDAQYQVEKEKCDVLAGPAKDNCLTQAKTRFGK